MAEARAARHLHIPMSEWDALSDDDQAWALALDTYDQDVCPVCGGHDPANTCQNLATQHAWEVTFKRCYKQRAVLMAVERFKNDPYASTVVPVVRLNRSRLKQ